LDALLQGEVISAPELDAFILNNPDESPFHDFKDGSLLTTDRRRAIFAVRKYVSGFANAEGGVLVLGVNEQRPRALSPCAQIGSTPVDIWAETLVHDMVPFFSPLPRFKRIGYARGDVLLIAAPRAPVLVPCVESRGLKYFMRIGQSTIEIPAYLLADLVLGRRQHPSFRLTVVRAGVPSFAQTAPLNVELSFLLDNVGLVPAEWLELGMLCWSEGASPTDINSHLLYYATVVPPRSAGLVLRHEIVRHQSPTVRLSPFSRLALGQATAFRFPLPPAPVTYKSAIYVLSKSSPPTWFQYDFQWLGPDAHSHSVELSPLLVGRPEVSCSA
jgi:Putative DNA-binding domain